MRFATTFSLLCLGLVTAFGSPIDDFRAAKSKEEQVAILRREGLTTEADRLQNSDNPVDQSDAEIALMSHSGNWPSDVSQEVKAAKDQGEFVPGKELSDDSWAQDAMRRMGRLIPKSKDERLETRIERDGPSMTTYGGPDIGGFVVYLIYIALAAALGYVIFLLGKQMSLSRKRVSTMDGLIDEEEAMRPLDEWLQMADQYEREGKIREAIRCLYVACLMQCDARGIAEFRRMETNWEHLRRIQSSGKLNSSIDIYGATSIFDRAWYGYLTKGREDVDMVRQTYVAIRDGGVLVA